MTTAAPRHFRSAMRMTRTILAGAVVGLALVAVAPVTWSAATAQSEWSGEAWTTLPGRAIDLAVNEDAQAYALDSEGRPWRWRAAEQRWSPMSGAFVRIAAAEGNRPWAVDAEGVLYRYNGLWWEEKLAGVVDVGASAEGVVFAAMIDGGLRRWNPLRNTLEPAAEAAARRIAVAPDGAVWILDAENRPGRLEGNRVVLTPGRARDIAAAGDGTILIADADGRARRWTGGRWALVEGPDDAIAIAGAPDGGPWVALADGRILARTLIVAEGLEEEPDDQPRAQTPQAPQASAPSAVARVPAAPGVAAPPARAPSSNAPLATSSQVTAEDVAPDATGSGVDGAAGPQTVQPAADRAGAPIETITLSGPIAFTDTRDTAKRLAIGRDGSVFALEASGALVRWSNARNRFESFAGSFAQIAVAPDGTLWGVSTLGRVFRFDAGRWLQVRGVAGSDIAIGADGSIAVANSQGRIFRATVEEPRFRQTPETGVLVALDPQGVLWSITEDRFLQRCDETPCTRLPQKAVSLDIGPDGSLFIVSDRNRLLRYDGDANEFERIETRGRTPVQVAVGPQGAPWFVADDDRVFASRFFERDEGADRQVALSARENETGAGQTDAVVSTQVGGFTFTKTMQFETIDQPIESPLTLSQLVSGADESVWSYRSSGMSSELIKYNVARNKFEKVTTGLENQDVQYMDVDTQGRIWATLGSGSLVRAQNKTVTTISGAPSSPFEVHIDTDDTVWLLSSGRLYRKPSTSTTFTQFGTETGIIEVAVTLPGDVWITVGGDKTVKQWTGGAFENRPKGRTFKADLLAGGADGTVYILDDDNALRKWNATNNSFDEVRNTNFTMLQVDEDGRPWVGDTSPPKIQRARD